MYDLITTLSSKRTFSANGSVDPTAHFFVDPSEWNEQHLVEPLLKGRYSALIAPSQSGKTTRVKTLINQLNNSNDNIICVYIDLMKAFLTNIPQEDKESVSFLPSFIDLFKDVIQSTTNKRPNVSEFMKLFSLEGCADWYDNKRIILIIDEVDCLERATEQEREHLLSSLRCLKQENKTQNCLLSLLVITNYIGDYLLDTIGNSPFNAISEYVSASYFSIGDLHILFKQHEDQEGIAISKEVIEDIFTQTNGAQGLTAMYGKLLNQWITNNNKVPSFSEWANYSNSKQFFIAISNYPNYQRMIRAVNKDESCKMLLLQLLSCGSVFDDPIVVGRLISANILTMDHEFANPFAKKLMISLLNPINTQTKLIGESDVPFDGSNIDFLKLVCQVIPRINPLSIAGAHPMTRNYCGTSYPIGPKEAVYLHAFNTALNSVLSTSVDVIIYPEVSAGSKSCDSVLKLCSQQIAVEHGCNLMMDKNSDNRMSVVHHVKKQGEIYHEKLKVDQTWVINWTTVPESVATVPESKLVRYYFPESVVNTLYIYHDKFFQNVKIVSKNYRQEIKMPSIDFLRKEDLSPSKKKKKLNPIDNVGSSQTHPLQRVSGMLKMGDTELDKSNPKRWSTQDIIALLKDTGVGVGLSENRAKDVDIEGSDFENIIDALVRFKGEEEAKIEHACKELSMINDSVRKSVVRWVLKNLLK